MKPFFEEEELVVVAHRGGKHLAPENTITAFEKARELEVNAIEFDIHMTKDHELVAIHDATVDRTTDGSGKVGDMRLEDLKELDAGYYFQNEKGDYSFRNQNVVIPTVEEIFEQFPDMKMFIEIKDTNEAETIPVMVERLWNLIQKYGLEERVLVGSFDQTIIDLFDEAADGRVAVGAGRQEVMKWVAANKLFLNGLYRPKVDAIQIPTEQKGIDLTSKRLIEFAQRWGMPVHYWTINDEETMRYLLEQGADGIITDRPDLLLEVLEEMGK
ncbi:glycerophosphoryl diester phosphodiesterase [Halalkalibacter wakoensis JCM 9140]|uniref:Glycerophosphoryl diester phosphodiesterase n=1 Tax=Halalkalibacter wakoensis JCM 9140 TaxID=1236970 RepID=W4QAI2_9BACI|nr:glycerophosphoryl diester phosphodiesterase [Halalkalibacter wakoensis JCM 9140]